MIQQSRRIPTPLYEVTCDNPGCRAVLEGFTSFQRAVEGIAANGWVTEWPSIKHCCEGCKRKREAPT